MPKQVAWNWVAGACCPECGGAVEWLTEEVPDRHSVTGFSSVKQPIVRVYDKQMCPLDEEFDEVVSSKGHADQVKRRYRHKIDVYCKHCGMAFSSYCLEKSEPKEYPPGYWVEVK